MGMAQTGRPITTIIEKTAFAEMWEQRVERQGRGEDFRR